MVAYKLIQVMYERAECPGMKWLEMLEFAEAIATVGDVMKTSGREPHCGEGGI